MRTTLISAVIVAAVVAGFVGFAKPGHQLRYKVGFTGACGTSDGCS